MSHSLSERERRFVEAYMGEAAGNATKAAELAGYGKKPGSARRIGTRLLSKVHIQAAIEERVGTDGRVATRAERQAFLTAVMRGSNGFRKILMRDRLKAADQLAKTQGDYIKRIQLEGVPAFRLIKQGDARD